MPQPLIRIQCPSEIFDREDAVVLRHKRVPIGDIDALSDHRDPKELRKALAILVPKWENICDIATGTALTNPEDDPEVLARIDFEQLAWIRSCLSMSPRSPNILGPAQT